MSEIRQKVTEGERVRRSEGEIEMEGGGVRCCRDQRAGAVQQKSDDRPN